MPLRNLILVGYRGAGKTAVGRAVARRLGWTFVDTDERIEAQAGQTIRELFAAHGEAHFRRLESQIVEALAVNNAQVIAVGGGAILSEANRERFREMGRCVWLTASPEELLQRTQADPRTVATRPPLTDLDALAEVRGLLAERTPLYAAVADQVVATEGLSVEQIADAVVAAVQEDPSAMAGS
jgi:shikimate kinase